MKACKTWVLAMASSDPRQPSAARPYVPPLLNPQDLPPDYSSFLAILFGIAGVMLRYKLGSWLALICCAQSLANMKNAENDLKQIIMAMTFAVMGIVTNYLAPSRQAVRPNWWGVGTFLYRFWWIWKMTGVGLAHFSNLSFLLEILACHSELETKHMIVNWLDDK